MEAQVVDFNNTGRAPTGWLQGTPGIRTTLTRCVAHSCLTPEASDTNMWWKEKYWIANMEFGKVRPACIWSLLQLRLYELWTSILWGGWSQDTWGELCNVYQKQFGYRNEMFMTFFQQKIILLDWIITLFLAYLWKFDGLNKVSWCAKPDGRLWLTQ